MVDLKNKSGDTIEARKAMVDCQLRTCGVTDHEVLRAFGRIPREKFVPKSQTELAYLDTCSRVQSLEDPSQDRYIMAPAAMAKLVELAEPTKSDDVLDVACASGYSSAILAQMVNAVVSIESDKDLAVWANENLNELGIDNAVVVSGEQEKGYPNEGPYDLIFINGAIEEVPEVFFDQLKDGGRLVAIIGNGNNAQATRFTKNNGSISAYIAFNYACKPLPGFEKAAEFTF